MKGAKNKREIYFSAEIQLHEIDPWWRCSSAFSAGETTPESEDVLLRLSDGCNEKDDKVLFLMG
jgi:hypothetical protein